MLKYMINLHQQKLLEKGKAPQARRFICFDEAFHGRTVFALSVTQISVDPILTKGFHGFAPGNIQIPFPAVDAMLSDTQNNAKTGKAPDMIETFLTTDFSRLLN